MDRVESAKAEEPGMKILLVDDEDQFRMALSRQLSVRGFEVLDVDNGEDAIKIVRHENPKVVILDQQMPGMDGIQTLKEIKKIRPEVQVTVPMATLSGASPLMVGLATAFSSSFAHMLVIGTPNNAIVYGMAGDPETGEQLLTMKDFFVRGFMVLLLSFAVLWLRVFLGYWKWMTV